jgi:segregation and condensation protein B
MTDPPLWTVDGDADQLDALPLQVAEPIEEEPEPPPPPAPPPAAKVAPPSAEVPPPLTAIIEALLFVGGEPLTATRATQTVRGLTTDAFLTTVADLNRRYRQQQRPYLIQSDATGCRLVLRPAYRVVRERWTGAPRAARLAQPALDTLATVAYRQPLTKAEVDSARGSESGPLLRQLVRLGLIALVRQGTPAVPVYVTTPRFLDAFGLGSLDDLPRTGDPQQI